MAHPEFAGGLGDTSGFATRHSKTVKEGQRPVSEEGAALARERALSQEFAQLVDYAPLNAVIFLGGASDSIRTHQTGEIYGDTLVEAFEGRTDVHVIPPNEIRQFAEEVGAAPVEGVRDVFGPGAQAIVETVQQIKRVIRDHPNQKVLVGYPLTLKELSPLAPVAGVMAGGRWRFAKEESAHTDYTKYLLEQGKQHPPDGDLREWFRNKGIVNGSKVGPNPEEVATAYLTAFARLKAFVVKQLPDRPAVVGLVGHSWDLDALAVYLGNGGVIDEAGYDRIRGSDHMIKETELMQFTVTGGQATLDYRGRTFPVTAELEAEQPTQG